MGCELIGSGCWGRPDVVELTLASNGWAHVGKVMHTWYMICSTVEGHGVHGQLAGAWAMGCPWQNAPHTGLMDGMT